MTIPFLAPPVNLHAATGESRLAPRRSGPLPLPVVPTPRCAAAVYGMAAIDDRGRICEQVIVRALRWSPGQRVTLKVHRGAVLVTAHCSSPTALNAQGYLRVPASLRHGVGLQPGDRVLLVARPDRQTLTLYPPTVLDALFDTDLGTATADEGEDVGATSVEVAR